MRVTFTVQADQSAFLDRQMRWKVEKGDIDAEIGNDGNDHWFPAVILGAHDRGPGIIQSDKRKG